MNRLFRRVAIVVFAGGCSSVPTTDYSIYDCPNNTVGQILFGGDGSVRVYFENAPGSLLINREKQVALLRANADGLISDNVANRLSLSYWAMSQLPPTTDFCNEGAHNLDANAIVKSILVSKLNLTTAIVEAEQAMQSGGGISSSAMNSAGVDCAGFTWYGQYVGVHSRGDNPDGQNCGAPPPLTIGEPSDPYPSCVIYALYPCGGGGGTTNSSPKPPHLGPPKPQSIDGTITRNGCYGQGTGCIPIDNN